MAQTKAERQAAAKKAAATRKRNQSKARSQTAGKKAAATRQSNEAADSAKQAGGSAVLGLAGAAKSVAHAAKQAGKSVASRVGAMRSGRR
ncbi:MAG: hypothetical protein ACR2ML_02570 [Solirubrobacteraceae bacterium]